MLISLPIALGSLAGFQGAVNFPAFRNGLDQKLVLNLRGSWFGLGAGVSTSALFAGSVEWDEGPKTASLDLAFVVVTEVRYSGAEMFLAELEGTYFQIRAGQHGQ